MEQTPGESVRSKAARFEAVIAASPWCASLSADIRDEIAQHLVERSFATGEVLFAQNEDPTGLFGVVSGTVQTIGSSADGIDTLLALLRPGDWTGFIGILSGRPNSFSTIASSVVEAVYLPRNEAQAIFTRDAKRLLQLAQPVAVLLRYIYSYLTEINGRTPKRVVAQRLIDLSRCVSVSGSIPSGKLESVSQDEIATATFLTRPTVNRILQHFAKTGVVTVGYARVDVIDIPALQAIASDPGRAKSAIPKNDRFSRSTAKPTATRLVSHRRVREILMTRPWFLSLAFDTREAILSRLQIKRLESGNMLYCKNDKSEGLFAVLSGQLRTSAIAQDRRRTLMSIVHPGDWTGFLPLIDGRGQPLDCHASQPSFVALLPMQAAREIFNDVVSVSALIIPPATTLRMAYEFLIETNGRSPGRLVAQRLFDLALAPHLGKSTPRDFIDNISQADIAEATGLSRPSVNKVLSDLAQYGIVTLGYGKIRINRAEDLLRYAQGKEG